MTTKVLKPKFIITSILLSFVMLSCGSKKEEKQASAEIPVKVKVATAELKDYPVTYSFSGKLEADKQSNLSTRIMGQIEKIYVKPGQKVKKGQVLIQIRNQDILAKKAQVEASKAEAQTAFESAEKDLKRFEALYASKSASEKEMDNVRTQYNMAKARLAAVEQMEKEVAENLQYAIIRAPYDGVISGKFVQEGDMANPGMPLLSIQSKSQWKVVARIPEQDIAKLKLNDEVNIRFKAINKDIKGQIVEITPSTGSMGNQYQAKIALQIPEGCTAPLYAGMYAEVLFDYGTQKQIRIPSSALVHRGQLVGLFALSQDSHALLRWVKTGNTYGDKTQILSGLSHGEKYVAEAEGRLIDGALVTTK